MAAGNRDEALLIARRILELEPDNAFALFVLGSVYLADRNLSRAETCLRRSLERSKTAAALNQLAYTLHLQGRNPQALPLAVEAVKLSPTQPELQDTLTRIRSALPKYNSPDVLN